MLSEKSIERYKKGFLLYQTFWIQEEVCKHKEIYLSPTDTRYFESVNNDITKCWQYLSDDLKLNLSKLDFLQSQLVPRNAVKFCANLTHAMYALADFDKMDDDKKNCFFQKHFPCKPETQLHPYTTIAKRDGVFALVETIPEEVLQVWIDFIVAKSQMRTL